MRQNIIWTFENKIHVYVNACDISRFNMILYMTSNKTMYDIDDA